MADLKIFFLGTPQLEQYGQPVAIDRYKAVGLLAYLVLNPQLHHRDTLAALFWPDLDQSRARAGLRRVLTTLKQALGPRGLLTDRETVGLAPACTWWVDVWEFQQCIVDWRTCTHPAGELCLSCVDRLAAATTLYRSDLLTGFTLRDAPAFDDWLYFAQERLRNMQVSVLEQLVHHYHKNGEWELALAQASRWQALDPVNESVHRWLMLLYDHTGRYVLAQRQYERCVQRLQEELDLPPEEATVRLFQSIKHRRLAATTISMEPAVSEVADPAPRNIRKGNTPVFVARERELAQLHTTLRRVLQGAGQPLFVIGGPGRGKTMLVQEFARQALMRNDALLLAGGICNAHAGVGDPFLPFQEVINQLVGADAKQESSATLPQLQSHRLSQALPFLLPLLVERAPELVESFVPGQRLLHQAATFAQPGQAWVQHLKKLTDRSPSLRLEQRQLFSQFTAFLKAVAQHYPLLIILEDLHWADASSTSLLFHLSRHLDDARILLLGTYRPNEVHGHEWALHSFATLMAELRRRHGDIWLDLAAMNEAEGRHFVNAYLDTEPHQLSASFRQALFAHTLGHPLFTVELLRAMQERGDLMRDEHGRWIVGERIDWQMWPAKVEGVIAQRFNGLDEELQRALVIASVEGEVFTAEVVASVQGKDERQLVQRLSQEAARRHRLVTPVGVERVGDHRLSHFRFRHHLFQQYLYQQLAESERLYLHEDVGKALAAFYGDQTEPIAVQLAQHFQQARVPEQAIIYLLQAGRRANRLAAHQEAITHLTQGLAQVATLPDPQERLQTELDLQLAIGPAYRIIKGYTSPELEQTYERAYTLCRQLEAAPPVFPVLWGICSYYMTRIDLQKAWALAEQCIALAQQQQDPHQLLAAHRAYATIAGFRGNFRLSRTHFETAIAIYQAQGYRTEVLLYGMDNGLVCLSYLTWILWILGYPDQARRYARQTLAQVQQVAHPFSQTFAQALVCHLWISLGEWETALAQTQALVALAVEYGAVVWASYGRILQGAALAGLGQSTPGLALMHQGLTELQEQGLELSRRYFLARLATAYAQTGDTAQALELVQEALASISETTDCYYEAELHRQKGVLLLQCGTQDSASSDLETQAEACFCKAIAVACQQESKSFELRAVMNLAHLWQRQGKQREARSMLAEIYGWFTEGLDTADLWNARQLLEKLDAI